VPVVGKLSMEIMKWKAVASKQAIIDYELQVKMNEEITKLKARIKELEDGTI